MSQTSPSTSPLGALQAGLRQPPAAPARPTLLVAGATGVLGNEVLRRLVGSGNFGHTGVMASAPMTMGLGNVGIVLAQAGPIAQWTPQPGVAHTAIVMFEPQRVYYGRERTLWVPAPEDLPALAAWLRRSGVQTLVVVVPHATGRLPEALKRGLASLDEHAVAALGFERLLLVRSARSQAATASGFFEKTAAWMLSALKYMIPANEQPVRPAKLAEFVNAALRAMPPGTHVAAPELLWQANQSGPFSGPASPPAMEAVVRAWLAAPQQPGQNPLTPVKPY